MREYSPKRKPKGASLLRSVPRRQMLLYLVIGAGVLVTIGVGVAQFRSSTGSPRGAGNQGQRTKEQADGQVFRVPSTGESPPSGLSITKSMDDMFASFAQERNAKHLETAHGTVTPLLSQAMALQHPVQFLKEHKIKPRAIPVARCGERYSVDRPLEVLGRCLPFARRGALLVVGEAEASAAEQRAELELAAALGAAGFLVLFRAPPGWSELAAQEEGWYWRRGAGLFVARAPWDTFRFMRGSLSADDPVGAPVLFLGSPSLSPRMDVDFDALATQQSPVLVLASLDGTDRRQAFLSAVVCSPGVALTVVHDDDALAFVDGLPRHCQSPVMVLEPSIAGLSGSDAVAAHIAIVLSEPFDASQYLENRATQAQQAPLVPKDDDEAMTSRHVVEIKLEPDGSIAPRRGPHCPDTMPSSLAALLVRCLPGRRAAFLQANTAPWDAGMVQRPRHMSAALGSINVLVVYSQQDRVLGVLQRVPGAKNVFLADASFRSCSPLRGLVVGVHVTAQAVAPGWIEQVRESGNDVIYEYTGIPEEASNSETAQQLKALRKQAVEQATLVTYSAKALEKDIEGGPDSVSGAPKRAAHAIALVPNGVDPSMYRVPEGLPVPHSIQDIVRKGKPIIGFFGTVAPWVWLEAVVQIALGMQEAEILIIGPQHPSTQLPDPSSTPANLHFHEAVPSAELVAYASQFTVGFIPFRRGHIAQATSPLKLFEYFAMGLPTVVTTGMDECTQYKHVRAASTAEEYINNLREAIADAGKPDVQQEIRELAQANSWGVRAATLLDALTGSLVAGR